MRLPRPLLSAERHPADCESKKGARNDKEGVVVADFGELSRAAMAKQAANKLGR